MIAALQAAAGWLLAGAGYRLAPLSLALVRAGGRLTARAWMRRDPAARRAAMLRERGGLTGGPAPGGE